MASAAPPLASQPELIDSWRAWLVAVGAGLSCGVAFGTIYTFGAFIESMSAEFGTGQGGTSVMIGIATLLFFSTGIISGPLLHRLGPRPLLAVGGAMFVAGLVLTSSVSQISHGYVVYGIGCGFGAGLFVSPLFATAASWFLRNRAVSQGLVATGPGLGTMFLVPLAERMIENLGWREAFRWLAVIAAITFVVCFVLVRRTPIVATAHPREHVRLVCRTKAFWLLTIGSALFAVPVIGSLAAIIPFARSAGISASAAGVAALGCRRREHRRAPAADQFRPSPRVGALADDLVRDAAGRVRDLVLRFRPLLADRGVRRVAGRGLRRLRRAAGRCHAAPVRRSRHRGRSWAACSSATASAAWWARS